MSPVLRDRVQPAYGQLQAAFEDARQAARGADVVVFRRDDIVLGPIAGLPPMPLGLIWCTAHENARIRALADTARRLSPDGLPRSWRSPRW